MQIDRRRVLIRLARFSSLSAAVVALTATGTAFAAYNVWTGEYTLTRQELEHAVGQRFPATLRYGQLVSVELTHPHLLFDPATNRITTEVDAQMANLLLQGVPIKGTLAISSSLKYDPAQRAVLLDNPNVERVRVDGMPAEYGEQLNAIGGVVATQVLNQYPIYKFKPEQLRYGGREVEPGAITVLPDGLKVEVRQR
ncbi:hypothetical protein PTE30175_02011 [Pandoraea terrae]|uniref:DUF1439 domain-containing protein n=1 Tax=Pandoraea terrae TaxID=1537710 RepID=A0A5E4UMP2_9BURK|nr:DUF1439 domain-containing protein [Pandoraea terrae]VVE00145.1 hypothetical protein PTE30175_02011 [Pandoraea terrae]